MVAKYLLLSLCYLSAALALQKHDKQILADVDSLIFKDGQMAVRQRSEKTPQLTCTHGDHLVKKLPNEIFCENMGPSVKGDKNSDPLWKCSTKLESSVRLGADSHVVCEGYNDAKDNYILRGSCALLYTLEPTDTKVKEGWFFTRRESVDDARFHSQFGRIPERVEEFVENTARSLFGKEVKEPEVVKKSWFSQGRGWFGRGSEQDVPEESKGVFSRGFFCNTPEKDESAKKGWFASKEDKAEAESKGWFCSSKEPEKTTRKWFESAKDAAKEGFFHRGPADAEKNSNKGWFHRSVENEKDSKSWFSNKDEEEEAKGWFSKGSQDEREGYFSRKARENAIEKGKEYANRAIYGEPETRSWFQSFTSLFSSAEPTRQERYTQAAREAYEKGEKFARGKYEDSQGRAHEYYDQAHDKIYGKPEKKHHTTAWIVTLLITSAMFWYLARSIPVAKRFLDQTTSFASQYFNRALGLFYRQPKEAAFVPDPSALNQQAASLNSVPEPTATPAALLNPTYNRKTEKAPAAGSYASAAASSPLKQSKQEVY